MSTIESIQVQTLESFSATMELRWVAVSGSTLAPVLQQMWQGSQGTVEWRDVPTQFIEVFPF